VRFASALFQCQFQEASKRLASQAKLIANLKMNSQLESIKSFMPNNAPLIGGWSKDFQSTVIRRVQS